MPIFTPQFDIENAVPMRHGMGVEAAFINGYKHGWQDKVTIGVCSLVNGTDEYDAWMRGYIQGEADILEAHTADRENRPVKYKTIAQ